MASRRGRVAQDTPEDDPYINLLIAAVKRARKDTQDLRYRQEAAEFLTELRESVARADTPWKRGHPMEGS